MSYVTWKLEHIPYNNGWNDDDKVELTDFHKVLVRTSVGDSKDSFNFSLTNFNKEYDNYFKPNDKITIYRIFNADTVTTADILMVGTIKDTPEMETGSSLSLKIEGFNFSEMLANALVFVDAPNLTIPEFLEEALANASNKNPNFQVTWNSGNAAAISGLTFPVVVESRFFHKPLKTILEKYSVSTETNNGDFYWYVDNNNTLVWRQKQSGQADTFNYATDEFIKYRDSKDIKGVKNYIILKGGNDPAGNPIQTRYLNESSVSKHGVKYFYHVSIKNTSSALVDKDIKSSYGIEVPNVSFPKQITEGTSFTTSWKSGYNYVTKNAGITVTKGNTITINEGSQSANEKAYTELIRTEIKLRLADEGFEITELLQYGKLRVEIDFKAGKKSWIRGDVIDCIIPKISDKVKKMRVKDIQYSSESDSFSLEEDEGTL